MGTWSIEPNNGLVSIDNNGLLIFQEHTTDISYTIKYNDSECGDVTKEITIRACSPTCDCSSLTVTGKTDISSDSGSNVTIGSFSKASCMSNVTVTSSESWLSDLVISGNDVKATVSANTDVERTGSVTITVDKDDGGTCQKTMSIKQVAGEAPCPHVDETIDIKIYRASMSHHQTYMVLVDGELTDDAKEWVKNNGYHYQVPTSLTEDLYIGEYRFVGCEVGSFVTDCKYCSLRNGNYSNKKLEVGGKYHIWYYKESTNYWLDGVLSFTMPTAEYCQEHVEAWCNCCWVIYDN